MKSPRFLNRQLSASLTAFLLLLATALPGFIPAFASADTLTTRSISLDSAAAGAPSATYDVSFHAATDAAAFVINFCTDSPILGQTCTAPSGLRVDNATTSSSGYTVTASTVPANNLVDIHKTITAGDDIEVVLEGVHNPTAVGTYYARIITMDTTAHAEAYIGDGSVTTGNVDNGGIALATTSSIGVTAAVRESLTFCVASATITASCANASSNPPSLLLGEGSGSAKALSASAVSTGTLYTQLSTNAASGAAINLKSGTDCGGLKRAGAASCDITPAAVTFSSGSAKFGIKTAASSTSTGGVTDATGSITAASGYSSTDYFLRYNGDNSVGVTSSYGDPLLTASGVTNNQNMQLTFGASISNNTPAGLYTTNMSMIATGKF